MYVMQVLQTSDNEIDDEDIDDYEEVYEHTFARHIHYMYFSSVQTTIRKRKPDMTVNFETH